MQDWHVETSTAGQAKLQQVHLKTGGGVLFEEVSLSKQQVNWGGFMASELTSASPLLPSHTLLVTAQEESQEEQPHINWTLNVFESYSRQQLHGIEEAWSHWKIKTLSWRERCHVFTCRFHSKQITKKVFQTLWVWSKRVGVKNPSKSEHIKARIVCWLFIAFSLNTIIRCIKLLCSSSFI